MPCSRNSTGPLARLPDFDPAASDLDDFDFGKGHR